MHKTLVFRFYIQLHKQSCLHDFYNFCLSKWVVSSVTYIKFYSRSLERIYENVVFARAELLYLRQLPGAS